MKQIDLQKNKEYIEKMNEDKWNANGTLNQIDEKLAEQGQAMWWSEEWQTWFIGSVSLYEESEV